MLRWDAMSQLWELACQRCEHCGLTVKPHGYNRWQARLLQRKPGLKPYQVFGACSYKGSTLGIAACKAAIRLLEAG